MRNGALHLEGGGNHELAQHRPAWMYILLGLVCRLAGLEGHLTGRSHLSLFSGISSTCSVNLRMKLQTAGLQACALSNLAHETLQEHGSNALGGNSGEDLNSHTGATCSVAISSTCSVLPRLVGWALRMK